MENTGEFYYGRGIQRFEAGQYEDAVRDLIEAYNLGYQKEQIIEQIYSCFILPNEEEFRENYRQGSAGFVQLPFASCTLDFVPVSEGRFFIFDKERREFLDLFAMAGAPVQGKMLRAENILFGEVWDIREMLPDMEQNQRTAVYVLPGKWEARFASFFKLPGLKDRYFRNVIVFQDEAIMQQFFAAFPDAALPGEVVAKEPERYWELIHRMHGRRVSGFLAAEAGLTPSWELFAAGKQEEAYAAAMAAVHEIPNNFTANRDARLICAAMGRYGEAVRYDTILDFLREQSPEASAVGVWTDELLGLLSAQSHLLALRGDTVLADRRREEVAYLKRRRKVAFGLGDQTYKSPVVGTFYEDPAGGRWYNACYDAVGFVDILPEAESMFRNWVLTKLECLQAAEAESFAWEGGEECLLPVLQEKLGAPYKFITADGREYVCKNKKAKRFEYYRLPPGTRLEAEEPLLLGRPVSLKQDAANKKLALNIFVDGLSQQVIEEEGLAALMPFTEKFFSKGVRCENAYAAGEWTLPSIAAYSTGLSTVNHMVIHNYIVNALPQDVTVLAEYFKEHGYQTAKIDGDWRSHLPYGYGRGMDRIIQQYLDTGMKAGQAVEDVLNHLELMKETNQFVWMCIGDLHHIADGYALDAAVQAKIPLECRTMEEKGVTSVKQRYSRQKRVAYIEQMKHIDHCLEALYRYLEENYQEDEMVVSMFGDHGQGYLVREDEHFLAEGRAKVGMMFRGAIGRSGVCKELISACDYLPMMCHFAGLPLKEEKIDGKLPAFFGGAQEREYAITESIHPGDPYAAAIYAKEEAFYFTSGGLVSSDGRFELGDYQCRALDKHGRECKDEGRRKHYFDLLMQHIGKLVVR